MKKWKILDFSLTRILGSLASCWMCFLYKHKINGKTSPLRRFMARVASYLLSRQRHLRHGCPAAALRNSKSLHLIRGSLLPLKFSLLPFPQMFPAPQSQTTQRIRPTPPPNSAEHTTVIFNSFLDHSILVLSQEDGIPLKERLLPLAQKVFIFLLIKSSITQLWLNPQFGSLKSVTSRVHSVSTSKPS